MRTKVTKNERFCKWKNSDAAHLHTLGVDVRGGVVVRGEVVVRGGAVVAKESGSGR